MLALDPQAAPQTYIIAQNPAVLAQLMRENESRTLNPSAYTTPASVFNTLAVDIDPTKAEAAPVNESLLPLKTLILPASELSKLDPIVDEDEARRQLQLKLQQTGDDESAGSSKTSTLDRYNSPQDALHKHGASINQDAQMSSVMCHSSSQSLSQPPSFPIPCEIINALTQQIHSIDPMYKALQTTNINTTNTGTEPPQQAQLLHQTQQTHLPNNIIYTPSGATFFHQNACQSVPYSPGLPPHSDATQKSRSLERNMSANVTYASRISSLDRMQNAAQLKQTRSNSLTRQMSSGSNELMIGNPNCGGTFMMNSRSASLERGGRIGAYGCRTNSLERNNPQLQMPQPMPNMAGNDLHHGGSLERNQNSAYELMKRSYRGGSLERNHQNAMVNRSASLERNAQYQQMYRDSCKMSNSTSNEPVEPFQEEIYDFGGANVKSCASIALNKSISKGLIPPGTILPTMQTAQSPQQQQQQQPQQNQSNQSPQSPYAALNIKPQSLSATDNIMQYPNGKNSPYLTQTYTVMAAPQQQHQPIKSPTMINQTQQQQQVYTPNSVYTPMYPLMWSNAQQSNQTAGGPTHLVYIPQQQNAQSNSIQLMSQSQMVAQPNLQISQIPIPLCVNNNSQNAILNNSPNSIATAAVIDTASIANSNGYVAQVWTQYHFPSSFFLYICKNYVF